jgi:WXXGXW repeat (2 copies)
MKTKLLVILLLAGTSLFARTHVSIGIGIGGYYPYGYYYAPPPVYYAPPPVYYEPPPVYYEPPVAPYYAPGSVWISGYYYPAGPRRVWRPGYWARPPFAGAIWVGPTRAGGRFRGGHWRR